MRVRFIFTKEGSIRYVGHLDFMRFLQKALQRSALSCAYSRGFHPHLLLTFAAPLGIGVEGKAELMEAELLYRDPFPLSVQEAERLRNLQIDHEALPPSPGSETLCAMLNEVLPPGISVKEARHVDGREKKLMASLFAADYEITIARVMPEDLPEALVTFLAKDVILVKTVKDEETRETDIRPLVEHASLHPDGDHFRLAMRIAQGSSKNLRPEIFLNAFCDASGFDLKDAEIRICRGTLYGADAVPIIEKGTVLK